ncbi:hypothetical protein KC19_4G054500 [Ceratodon purpureus]|uniref:FYVE-type domain-containing protein n=1 Tax=Ceratodon purpureus TaxID=3225 RepID=A0A8T0I5Z1_CERPU|nr:hypothetical protein KC19_4G054500 [Ceratodon purpureus]KAG0578853.1 hypothetical protein KC19_4G054500 [Ceratodon purpureus]
MGLEKMGLPPKPFEKGRDWTPDSTNCEGCQAVFTWINRKHHCRRCGGLFCNNCTLGRWYLRGQGDAPARVCEPCKQIEEAAKFERYSKSKAPRGGSKASSKDEGTDALLKQILKPDGKSGGDEVNLDSILASVTDNDSDDHEIASPSRENAPVSPTKLHEEAQEEKKRYSTLKKQGKDAEALKAFKRAKELERQAEAREKEIRHQRRVSTGSLVGQHSKVSPSKEDHASPDAERSSLNRRKSEFGENQKKRRTPSQDLAKEKGASSEKDDFLQELKALGWSDKEIREAEKKPAAKSEEQLLAELAAEVRSKSDRAATSAAPGPNDAMSTQITVHKRQALALKREGRLAEAKDELRKAKMLEKQAEEMALLGEAGGEDEASDDDEIHALIRRLEREEKLKGNAGKGGASQSIPEDFGLGFSFVDDDDDAHVEVDDDDLDDPEMTAALKAMGWEEDAAGSERTSKPHSKVTKPTQATGPGLKEQILARKRKALALKREGKIAEARAELAEAKKLEQQLENLGGVTTTSTIAKAPAQVSEPVFDVSDDKIEETEEKVEVTDEDMRDPEMMAALRAMGFGDDESTPSHEAVTPVTKPDPVQESSLKQEILGIKRQALALKREGRIDEARDTLRRAKVLEQQLDDLQAVSQRQEETPKLIKESRELRRGAQALPALSGVLNFGDEGEEEDVEVDNADLADPDIAAALAAIGWQEDPSDKTTDFPVAVPKNEGPSPRAAVVSDSMPANLRPVGEFQPQIVETKKVEVKKVATKESESTPSDSANPVPSPATSNPVISNKTKSQLQQELLGRKRRALALKREGKSDEARIELQEAKIIEQQLADLEKGLAVIQVAESVPVASVQTAQPPTQQAFGQLLKQDPAPSRPIYLDDEPVDEVEVTDDDMQDPALLAALAGMGWQGDKEAAGPSKSIPVSEKSSRAGEKESLRGGANSLGTQAQTGKDGEKVKNLLEFDWGDPVWHAKKSSKDSKGANKEQVVKSPEKDEEENPFEGEYGEIGQTMDLVPPLSGPAGPKDSAAPSQQRSPWNIFDRFHSSESIDETQPNKDSQPKKLPPFPHVPSKPPERPPPSAPSAKSTVVTATDATVSVQPATLSLQQEILALKRKALALKREGKAGEAREELRKAKLLERQAGQQGAQAVVASTSTTTTAGRGNVASAHAKVEEVSSTSTAVTPSRPEPPIAVKTSPQAAKSPGHKEEMQKQVRQTKDRMKLQQESLAHKRKAMGLRREGKVDEADAEYELAKALEKQMEDLDPMHGKEDLGDVAGVDDLLDPQLLAALKGVGFGDGDLAGASTAPKGPTKAPTGVPGQPRSDVGSSSRSSLGALEAEKKQLEEQIRAQKLQAVQLKRAGKQAEALDKLRGAKQLEKRLLALAS